MISSSFANKFYCKMAMLPPDPLFILRGGMSSLTCLCFHKSADIESLYAGTVNGTVHIWNVKTNREVDQFQTTQDSCLCIHPLKDDELLVQEKGIGISLWKKEDDIWSRIKSLTTDYFGFCKFIVEDNYIYIPSKDSSILLVSTDSFDTKGTISATDKVGEVMSFRTLNISEEKYILAVYESGDLILWECKELKKVSILKLDEECLMTLDFDVSSMRGVCAGSSNKVHIFSIKNLTVSVLRTIQLTNPGVACVMIRPDKRLFASGGWDGKIRLFSWKNFIALVILDTHSETVQDVTFSSFPIATWNSKCLMAAGSKDGTISLWELYNK